jgi:hypothetical protein
LSYDVTLLIPGGLSFKSAWSKVFVLNGYRCHLFALARPQPASGADQEPNGAANAVGSSRGQPADSTLGAYVGIKKWVVEEDPAFRLSLSFTIGAVLPSNKRMDLLAKQRKPQVFTRAMGFGSDDLLDVRLGQLVPGGACPFVWPDGSVLLFATVKCPDFTS